MGPTVTVKDMPGVGSVDSTSVRALLLGYFCKGYQSLAKGYSRRDPPVGPILQEVDPIKGWPTNSSQWNHAPWWILPEADIDLILPGYQEVDIAMDISKDIHGEITLRPAGDGPCKYDPDDGEFEVNMDAISDSKWTLLFQAEVRDAATPDVQDDESGKVPDHTARNHLKSLWLSKMQLRSASMFRDGVSAGLAELYLLKSLPLVWVASGFYHVTTANVATANVAMYLLKMKQTSEQRRQSVEGVLDKSLLISELAVEDLRVADQKQEDIQEGRPAIAPLVKEWAVEWLQELDDTKFAAFVQFITGAQAMASGQHITIRVMSRTGGGGAACNAHTCFQQLDIADFRVVGTDRSRDNRLTRESFRMQMEAVVV